MSGKDGAFYTTTNQTVVHLCKNDEAHGNEDYEFEVEAEVFPDGTYYNVECPACGYTQDGEV